MVLEPLGARIAWNMTIAAITRISRNTGITRFFRAARINANLSNPTVVVRQSGATRTAMPLLVFRRKHVSAAYFA